MRAIETLTNSRYGIDGSWSAVSIQVGTPAVWLDVIVSTVSSETWVVGAGGCLETGKSSNVYQFGSVLEESGLLV